MREIKFRGRGYKWIYGNLHVDDKGLTSIITSDFSIHLVSTDSVGQFTGLLDSKNQEIYEGDIVKCGDFVYEVVYEPHRFASFGLRRSVDFFMHYFGEAMEACDCEVIGNIFDTPELIEDPSNKKTGSSIPEVAQ